MFSARAFLHMPPSDREWTDDEIEQAGKTYYTAYRDMVDTVRQASPEARIDGVTIAMWRLAPVAAASDAA